MNRSISAVTIIRKFNPTLYRYHDELDRRLRPLNIAAYSNPPDELRDRAFDIITSTASELQTAGLLDDNARAVRLIVLHNPFAHHPVPPEVFTGPHDVQWSIIDTDSYGEAATGKKAYEIPGRPRPWEACAPRLAERHAPQSD